MEGGQKREAMGMRWVMGWAQEWVEFGGSGMHQILTPFLGLDLLSWINADLPSSHPEMASYWPNSAGAGLIYPAVLVALLG